MKIYICIFLTVMINIRNVKVDGQENIISNPILILATNYNFGLYTEEILKAGAQKAANVANGVLQRVRVKLGY